MQLIPYEIAFSEAISRVTLETADYTTNLKGKIAKLSVKIVIGKDKYARHCSTGAAEWSKIKRDQVPYAHSQSRGFKVRIE